MITAQRAAEQTATIETPRDLHLRAAAVVAVMAALAIALYYYTMTWWVSEWTKEGSFYAHGIFVPFFVVIMIWRDREKLRRLPLGRSVWGLGVVVIALAMLLVGQRAQVAVTMSLSFLFFILGAILWTAGKRVARALLFPVVFLFTMVPLVPDQLISPLALYVQLASTKLAAFVYNHVGFPATVTGTTIKMENFTLAVELPCSGFKTLLGLLAFSAAFAYVVEAKPWKRWIIFLSSGPLAVLVNGIRIALIGFVGELFGDQAAATFHDWSGFIVLIFGFMGLFSLARVLKCESFLGIPLMDPPKDATTDAAAGEDGAPHEQDGARAADAPRRPTVLDQARAGVVTMLSSRAITWVARGSLALIPLLALACIARPVVSEPRATYPALQGKDIPAALPDPAASAAGAQWMQHGGDIQPTQAVLDMIHPLAYVNRNYTIGGPNPGEAELLLTAGNGRKVFHDPHGCFLGSGYFMHDTGVEVVDTPRGPLKLQVAEAENVLTRERTLMMFCYVMDGRQLQTTRAVNTALIWQMLFGDSGRPSYFLRFMQKTDGVDEQKREQLRSFIRAVWTQIEPAVAGK